MDLAWYCQVVIVLDVHPLYLFKKIDKLNKNRELLHGPFRKQTEIVFIGLKERNLEDFPQFKQIDGYYCILNGKIDIE